MEFDKLFSDAQVVEYISNREPAENIIDTLFPSRKQEELRLEYLKGDSGLPVVANVHAYDTRTEVASRENVGEFYDELVLVKRQIPIREKDILRLSNTANDRVRREVIAKIFDDVGNMVDAVSTRVKAMSAEALSTGQLAINENGINITVDYGMTEDQKETLTPATDTWDVDGVNPLEHIFDWTDHVVSTTGVTPTRVLTSRRVVSTLMRSTALRQAIYGMNADRVISLTDINELMTQQGLPRIAIFDGQYRTQEADGTLTARRYIADNKFILMPPGPVGEQVFGPTAEELELAGKAGVELSNVGNVMAQIYRTQDPVARWTKAVATALPAFPAVGQVFVAEVL